MRSGICSRRSRGGRGVSSLRRGLAGRLPPTLRGLGYTNPRAPACPLAGASPPRQPRQARADYEPTDLPHRPSASALARSGRRPGRSSASACRAASPRDRLEPEPPPARPPGRPSPVPPAGGAERHGLDRRARARACSGQSAKVRHAALPRGPRATASRLASPFTQPGRVGLAGGDDAVLGEAGVRRAEDRRRRRRCGARPASQSASPIVTACATMHWFSSARAMAPIRTRAWPAGRVGRARDEQDLGARPRPWRGRSAGTRRRSRSRIPIRPIAVSKTRARVAGRRPPSRRARRRSGSACPGCRWLPSGAKRRARFVARPSLARRSGPVAAQMWTLNSRARLPWRSSTSLMRALTASIDRLRVAGVLLLGEARELQRGVLGKDQQLGPLLGGGAHPDAGACRRTRSSDCASRSDRRRRRSSSDRPGLRVSGHGLVLLLPVGRGR